MVALPTLAQEKGEPQRKFNPFKYNEDDFPIAVDISVGAGISNTNIQAGTAVSLDVFHILVGHRNLVNVDINRYKVTDKSFLFGYRYRTRHMMFSVASGIGHESYICINGENYICNQLFEAINLKSIPFEAKIDYVAGSFFAIGLTLDITHNDHEDIAGLMLTLKTGLFRNPSHKKETPKIKETLLMLAILYGRLVCILLLLNKLFFFQSPL